jgi:hypothetical protein
MQCEDKTHLPSITVISTVVLCLTPFHSHPLTISSRSRKFYSIQIRSKYLTYNLLWRHRREVDVQLYYFFNMETRCGRCLNTKPQQLTPGNKAVLVVQKAERVLVTVSTSEESLISTRIRSPDCPSPSKLLYRFHYSRPVILLNTFKMSTFSSNSYSFYGIEF